MAANVAYKVNGKADLTPLQKTEQALKKINTAASAMKTAIAGFAIAKVFQGANAVINGATDAFKNMNTALAKSNIAFSENAKLTKESVSNIREALSEFSAGNFFDGDSLNNAASIASQMGLDEEQIKGVMDAATEMAASGILPLEEAVKKLSESYQGNAGDLAKLCPELQNMTAEQIKSGAAVEAMKRQYDGFRDSMANTFSGRETQWKNTFGDLQASVGGIIQAFNFIAQGKFMKPLQELGTWISDHKQQIINFALHLPEIFSVALSAVKQIFQRTFTNEGILDLGRFIADSFGAWFPVWKTYFKGLVDFVKGIFDVTLGNIGRAVYNLVIIPMKKGFADAVNGFVEKHPKIAEFFKIGKIELDAKSVQPMDYAKLEDVTSNYAKMIEKATKDAQKALEKQKSINSDFASKYKGITDTAANNIKELLNQDLPKDLQDAFDAGAEKIKEAQETQTTPATPPKLEIDVNKIQGQFDSITNAFNSVFSSMGELGSVASGLTQGALSNMGDKMKEFEEANGRAASTTEIMSMAMNGLNAAMSSNIFGIILQIIAQIIGTINGELSKQSESFSKCINFISTIFTIVADKIAPIVEDLMKPLAGIFETIGEVIGDIIMPIMEAANDVIVPLMQALQKVFNLIGNIVHAFEPFISLAMKFLPFGVIIKGIAKVIELVAKAIAALYNHVLRPISNFLLKLVETVANGFIKMYNGIVRTFNRISVFGWHPFSFNEASEVSLGRLSEIDLSNTHQSDDDSSGNDSSKGGSASYTATSDVYVTIEFNQSYVNGDAEAIAVMLAREIRQAEKKNLI